MAEQSKITPEDRAAFIAELSELSRRYGIFIGGCGCCGSPRFDHGAKGREGGYKMRRENYPDDELYWEPED